MFTYRPTVFSATLTLTAQKISCCPGISMRNYEAHLYRRKSSLGITNSNIHEHCGQYHVNYRSQSPNIVPVIHSLHGSDHIQPPLLSLGAPGQRNCYASYSHVTGMSCLFTSIFFQLTNIMQCQRNAVHYII